MLGVALLAALAWLCRRDSGDPAAPKSPGTVAERRAPGSVAEKRAPGTVAEKRAPGTVAMARRLEALASALDPERNPFLNPQRIEQLRALLAEGPAIARRVELESLLARELLHAGRSAEAVEAFESLRELAERLPPEPRSYFDELCEHFLAISQLRVGEQQNCIARHGPDSCLLPIRGGGIHTRQEGSRAAIGHLEASLARQPKALDDIWLLNVAYMTLGEYPDRVPAQWRLPRAIFGSEYDLPRFSNVAARAGVDVMGLSGGSVMEDLDGDGDLDIVASSWGVADQIRVFINRGDGRFDDRTRESGLEGIVGGLNLCHADYDNDGFPDVLVLRGAWMHEDGRQPNSLLRNNGDGTFEDVTERAGLLSFRPTQTATWGDFDNDGDLDLFIGNESGDGEHFPCELFRNNGDGTFRECAAELGADNVGYVKGTAWGDIDNDGWLDLYLSRLEEPNVLLRNDRGRRFVDVSAAAGVTEPLQSFPTWFWDFDNDGWLDLFVADYAPDSTPADVAASFLGLELRPGRSTSRLYRNRGDGTFEDVSRRAHLDHVLEAMGANFGDLDNDGWLDLYVGTGEPPLEAIVPNRCFRNDAGERFQDVTTAGGFGHLQKGHGIAFGDVDGDGDQDIYEVMGGAYSGDVFQNVLFENPHAGSPNANHWITVRLHGVRSNRFGVGARIRVVVTGDPEGGPRSGGRREIHRVVSTGGSFGSSSLQQEIGLGRAARIERLEVTWPVTGEVQVVEGAVMDTVVVVREEIRSELRPSVQTDVKSR